MEHELIFAIDCDEVLRQTLDKMLALYNENFKNKKTRDDINDFMVEKSFPEIEAETGITASHWFFQEHSTDVFLETEAFPHIKEDITTLRKYGKVIILTHQKSYQNKIETLLWLEKNNIECDGVCFLKDKTLLSADYLIDDNDWNFIGSNVKHGVLIDAPHNKDKSLKDIKLSSQCETLERCASLHDFVEKFVKANQTIETTRKKYSSGCKYALKSSVPYTDASIHKKERLFGHKGDRVTIEYFLLRGTEALVRLKMVSSWGDVLVRAEELGKYI